MNFDTETMVAIFGFLGVLATALTGVYVATRTNKTEKADTAKAALEQTRDEAYAMRLQAKDDVIRLRDEQLLDRDQDIVLLKANLAEAEAENDTLALENRKLKGQGPT